MIYDTDKYDYKSFINYSDIKINKFTEEKKLLKYKME